MLGSDNYDHIGDHFAKNLVKYAFSELRRHGLHYQSVFMLEKLP